MSKLSATVVVLPTHDDIPSPETLRDEKHFLVTEVDPSNRDIYLRFSSRRALYDFARSLLRESVYGREGQMEFYPLIDDGKALVVDGVRLQSGSNRIFVSYPDLDNAEE